MEDEKFSNQVGYSFFWLIFFMIFELATGWTRSFSLRFDWNNWGFDWNIIIMFLKCFFLTLLVLRKWKVYFKSYFLALHIFYSLFILAFLYQFIFEGESSMDGWFTSSLAILGGWMALLFNHFTSRLSKLFVALSSIALIFLSNINYKFISQFNSYGTVTSTQNKWISPKSYSITNQFNKELRLNKDTLYIIDFWFIGCRSCYENFPKFEKEYLTNKNPKIKYLAVNYPARLDTINESFKVIHNLGYHFPNWQGNDSIASAFGLNVYPTLIVMRNDTLLFKGTSHEVLKDFLQNAPFE